MTNQQIIIDNKKRTVSSAKINNAAHDVFAVRTHLFGQFDDIGFKKDHFIFLDEEHCLRTKLLEHGNNARIDHLEFKIVEKLTIGNWYTQYYAGYWQLIDLKPKIAFDNYTGEEISWKKGDLIGYWAIMRKAFTPKMKKQIRVEFTDAASLKSVSDETETQIQEELNNDPDFLSRLNNSFEVSDMMVKNAWLSLTKEEKERLLTGIGLLPDRFTKEQLLSATLLPDHCFIKPPANYLLNLCSYPWEFTDSFNQLFFKAELIELEQ